MQFTLLTAAAGAFECARDTPLSIRSLVLYYMKIIKRTTTTAAAAAAAGADDWKLCFCIWFIHFLQREYKSSPKHGEKSGNKAHSLCQQQSIFKISLLHCFNITSWWYDDDDDECVVGTISNTTDLNRKKKKCSTLSLSSRSNSIFLVESNKWFQWELFSIFYIDCCLHRHLIDKLCCVL